ncbi:MAG: hypothetical protein HYU36_16735 [Planctomycetes bacterium]|nr:hypothetical protein [Planctomycetota bacterium]
MDRDALASDYSPEQIVGLQRTFPLYVRLPKDRWEAIRRAEALTSSGDRLFHELAEEAAARKSSSS